MARLPRRGPRLADGLTVMPFEHEAPKPPPLVELTFEVPDDEQPGEEFQQPQPEIECVEEIN